MTISCCFYPILLSTVLSFGGPSFSDRPAPVAVQPDSLETSAQVDTPVIFELRLKDGSLVRADGTSAEKGRWLHRCI
jgi:hypothetical protein